MQAGNIRSIKNKTHKGHILVASSKLQGMLSVSFPFSLIPSIFLPHSLCLSPSFPLSFSLIPSFSLILSFLGGIFVLFSYTHNVKQHRVSALLSTSLCKMRLHVSLPQCIIDVCFFLCLYKKKKKKKKKKTKWVEGTHHIVKCIH